MLSYQKIDHLPILLMAADMNRSLPTITQPLPELEPRPQRKRQTPLMVGVDLGGTQTRAAVVRDEEIIAKVSHPTPAAEGPAAVIAAIVAAVHEAMQMAETGVAEIGGIGISAPGPLNAKTGIVYETPNMHGWHDVPLRDEVAKAFPYVPVYLGHDATLAGFGEYLFGAGRGTSNMIYMTVSTGIGGGIIVEGKIVDGAIGTAGEIGHMYIDLRPDAPHDGIGHVGCLEALASGTAIARDANELIAAGQGQGIFAMYQQRIAQETEATKETPEVGHEQPHLVSARDVVDAAEGGDAEAEAILHAAAVAVGVGCVNLIHILNPEMIVIGGGVSKAGPLLFDPIHATIAARAFDRPGRAVQIAPAELGDDVGLIGAAAYVGYRLNLERR